MRKFLILALVWLATAALPTQPSWAQSEHFYSTLKHVHVAGFQGWFSCPADAAKAGWGHWFRGGTDVRNPDFAGS